jgi:hypothetical protein
MAKTWKTAAISMAIMAAALTADATQRSDDRPRVFVHIENPTGAVLPETIAGARVELAHIYDGTGVMVESSTEPDHDRCGRQFTVHVVLLAGAMADRFIKKEGVERRVVAQANSDARRIYVFWDRVGPSVNHQAVAHGDALGLVIAHELGHVMLPGRGHSRNGIMQENYDVYLSYRLKFTAEESVAMRAFIAGAQKDPRVKTNR